MDGVVKFEKQDELFLCFEDEQYKPGLTIRAALL